jgi:hypothetical protein
MSVEITATNEPKKGDWRTLVSQPKITEERKELATALSKAQAEIDAAPKSEANPFFKSSYADLATVRSAIREAFGKHGLSVVQIPHTGDGTVSVTTILMHASGQFIEGTLTLRPTKNDPQGVGSAITYARRYSLMAFAGVAPDDDDGNAASGHTEPPKKEHKPAQRSETKPAPRDNIHWPNLMTQLGKAGIGLDDNFQIVPDDKPLARELVYYCTGETITLEAAYKDPRKCEEAVRKVADGNREFPASGDNSLLSQAKEKLAEKASAH